MKFSASRTALLLQCNAPFQENVSEPPQKRSEAAALGTKVHEEIAKYLLSDPQGVVDDIEETEPYFAQWLSWWHEFLRSFRPTRLVVEEAMAFDTHTGKVRALPSKGHRDYSDLSKTEVAGTLDFAAFNAEKGWMLIDWKLRAPGNVHDMKDPSGQLRTLGSMFAMSTFAGLSPVPKLECFALEIHRDRTQETHRLRIDPRSPKDAPRNHLEALAKRLTETSVLRLGMECVHCPMRGACPALGVVNEEFKDLFEKDVLTAEDVRAGYGRLRVWEEKLRSLREAMKETVAQDGEVALSDTRRLVIEEVTAETLSKSSVLEAYGKDEGKSVLASLDAHGALRTSVSRRMVERNQ